MHPSILQTKKHFFALDGLRGVAAICVVIFHFSEFIYPSDDKSPIGHGFLAVDFFFCLSGFVIGYAYDDRIQKLGIKEFFISRLIRLHPLVAIGSVLGFLFFIFEPSKAVDAYSFGKLMLLFLCSALLIPNAGMDNRFNNNFGLNCPAWSLFWEYIANIVYAVVLKKLSKTWLIIVVTAGAIALLFTGFHAGNIMGGWAGSNFFDGLARIAFSFPMGLLLYRLSLKPRLRLSFTPLAIILIATFCLTKWNWFIECAVVIFIFPLIIIFGANAPENNVSKKLCTFLGNLSYPLYMTHYSLIWYFGNYHSAHKWNVSQSWWITAAGTCLIIIFAYAIQVTLDTPIRKYFFDKRKKRLEKIG